MNSPLTLYLLRHGESVANARRLFSARKADPPLSELGIEQAVRQAEALKEIKFSALYTSPLLRARQTAEIVGRQGQPTPIIAEPLKEVDVGVLDGESVDDPQGQAIYAQVISSWEQGQMGVGFPDGETLGGIAARLKSLLGDLTEREHGPVLLVGHSLLFAALIWFYCENHSPRFGNGHLGRGRLAIITAVGGRFHLDGFDVAPDGSGQEFWPPIKSGAGPHKSSEGEGELDTRAHLRDDEGRHRGGQRTSDDRRGHARPNPD